MVTHWAHNPKIGGSNPPPARITKQKPPRGVIWLKLILLTYL